MYQLKKQFRFEASHQLMRHDGLCARLHGHSWVGEIIVEGVTLETSGPKENMVVDFAQLSEFMQPTLEILDHQHLNTVLNEQMPTSEFIAKWLFDRWQEFFAGKTVSLKGITIKETCTSECTYSE